MRDTGNSLFNRSDSGGESTLSIHFLPKMDNLTKSSIFEAMVKLDLNPRADRNRGTTGGQLWGASLSPFYWLRVSFVNEDKQDYRDATVAKTQTKR